MWTSLLSSLRIDPTPEADFESRFIEDFHRRLQQETARVSLMSRFVGRVKSFVPDFAGCRWATAATTVLVMAFVLGSLMWPQTEVPKAVASVGSPVEQLAKQQKRVVADIAPSVLANREGGTTPTVIVSIRKEEKKKEEVEDVPAEIMLEASAE